MPIDFSRKPVAAGTPGSVSSNSSKVGSATYTYDYPTWKEGIIAAMANNIAAGPQTAGYPGGWDFNRFGTWDADIGNTAGVSGATLAKIASWIDSGAAAKDPWVLQNFGAAPPQSAGDYIESPTQYAQRISQEQWQASYDLNVRQQNFAEAKFGISLALDAAAARSSYSTGGGSRGGGGGGGGSSDGEYQAYLNAKLALDEKIAMGQLDLGKAQLEAEKQWKAEQAALTREQMAQSASQFQQSHSLAQEQFAFSKEQAAAENQIRTLQAQNERAATIGKMFANPSDYVARDYTNRGLAQPLGTPIDPFTGQQGTTQMTFNEVQAQNAAMVKPLGQPQVVIPQGAVA